MKRIYVLLLIVLSIFSLTSCDTLKATETITPTPSVTEKEIPSKVNVEIVQMNDIHGHIEQDSNGKNGISNAAYLIDKVRNEEVYDNTLVVANGDMFQETAISRLSYGRVVVDCMNEIGVDFMGVGNHEFDWGFDRIIDYFDGDTSNGEANFPLINSNIYYNNQLLLNDNIYESAIIEKENVNIGVISLIGNVIGSINANMSVGYNFKAQSYDMTNIVERLGKNLKDNGADIIVVNIHDGETSSVSDYKPNVEISKIKYNDEYLVDAVINGHTHTKQSGMITRTDGIAMPVIQSSGKLATMGRINLEFDTETKSITNVTTSHMNVSTASSNNVKQVEDIVDEYYNRSKNIIEEVYCQNSVKLNRYNEKFTNYIGNLMMKATGANAAVGNFAGFRNDVPVGELNFSNVYGLNPFDNHIILCKIKGSDLSKFYNDNKSYEYW